MPTTLKGSIKSFMPEWAWGQLQTIRRNSSVLTFNRRIVRHRYHGFEFDIELADSLAAGWYDEDWPDMREIILLSKGRLKKGARIFDLGAHQSVVALILSRLVYPGKVISVEADPYCASMGLRNRSLNSASNLEILHAAVAEKSGSIEFAFNGHIADDKRKSGKVSVPAFSIDDLAEKYGVPDVIFVDIEGYEQKALLGARKTLLCPTDWLLEVHTKAGLESFNGSVEGVLTNFPKEAFSVYVASADGNDPFVSLLSESAESVITDRFFLVALKK